MFYSQFILAKKGPLGTIWIAAHLERKLRKNQVADTDIGVSVDSILFPEVPIALRLSSHLLLGVVRIYSKKVNYLFDDCSDALLKVKQAFRSAAVDLPPEQSKAPYHSITLPETFDLDDFELPDNEVFQGNFVDHHVSTREQITLQDTMDGVSFPTSQFGPDERFGDGDASQIGLDLDEELFMDKGDAAGTSGNMAGTDAEPRMSPIGTSPLKADEHDEEIPDPPLASSTNYFVIQAPSTPGLTEEPNLPSSKEEIQVSDDHMDEDQNPCALAAKEVSGTISSPARPSDCSGFESHLTGNLHSMGEQDNGLVNTLKTESSEFISSDFAQPDTTQNGLANGQDSMENMLHSSAPDNDGSIAPDMLEKECVEIKEVNMNGNVLPVTENATAMEVEDAGFNKTDLNGNCHPRTDNGAEIDESSTAPKIVEPEDALTSGSEHQNLFQSSVNLNTDKISESSVDEKSSGFGTPFLRVCTSKAPSVCDGVDNLLDTSTLPAQENGLSSIGMSRREDAADVSEVLTNAQDVVEPTIHIDQTAYEADCAADSILGKEDLGGQQENLVAEENHSGKENNLQSSDFPPPEVLLSMPNLPAGLSGNFPIESTPSKEVLATNDDATGENIISGRKRSFTESTLTMQSFNSVESFGGAQSKGTVESIPDDNDLLSSILAGKRSTSFKMKPSPAVPDTVHAKRQRTAVRSAPHKRKVLVDDSTVLHGDTIRQQLTNTEDIRRVRKKAPCTNFEVWVLQKQFLEDDIFDEPVFTGMFPSLSNEAFDLNGIRIIRDDQTKGASVADKSAKPTLDEVTEGIESLEPSVADSSVRSITDEKTEAVETLAPSTAGDEGSLECVGIISAAPCAQDSIMAGSSTLTKEIENIDSVVMNHMSQYDASKEKHGMEFDDARTPVGDEAVSEPISSVDHGLEVACNSTDNDKVDFLNKSSNVMMSMHIDDASDQLLDQQCDTRFSTGDALTVEDIPVLRDQGVDVGVSKEINLDEKSDGEHLLEKKEGVDTDVDMGNFQDTCSLHVHHDTSDSMALEDKACPTSDHVVEACQPDDFGIPNKDETSFTGIEHDVSCLTSNNVEEHVKSDSPHSVEAYVSSQTTNLNETEGLQHLEADPKIDMESTPLPTEFTDAGNNVEFGADVIEHDTDFLNVDDDDVAEDYESDVPDHDEKRILDNSGWSARTRAVANYLQAMFEKESEQAKKAISLDSLLVGKSRKEASRMFFETLVLKTKDYVHAEQEGSFCDIKIKPRGKLMKPGF